MPVKILYCCDVVLSEGSSEANAKFVAETTKKYKVPLYELVSPHRDGEVYRVMHTRRTDLSKCVQELDYWDCWTIADIYHKRLYTC